MSAKNGTKQKTHLEKALTTQREELRRRINGRLEQVYVDREPDDEAAQASDSVLTDMTVATLERERRTLQEIESAIDRIQKGSYGLCAFCGEAITEARLAALPWARLCIKCAGRASTMGSAAAD